MAPGYKPASLTERVQLTARSALADALRQPPPSAEWMVASVFRRPLPFAPVDLAALGMAEALADAMVEQPERARDLVAALRSEGAAPIAVVGDSHSTPLVRRAWKDGRWMLPLHRLCTGASARGLINPEAAAGAGAKVRAFLAPLAAAPMPVVFKFGQVDVEFVFTFKRLETGATAFDPKAFDAFAAETVDRYLDFLKEAVPAPLRHHVWVAGTFPPALSDRAWAEGYVNAHIAELHGPADRAALTTRLAALELPPLAERTRLHHAFNTSLIEAAGRAGFKAMFGFKALLGEDGAVQPRYLGRAKGKNHHLGYAASRAPILEQLWKVVERLSPSA